MSDLDLIDTSTVQKVKTAVKSLLVKVINKEFLLVVASHGRKNILTPVFHTRNF